MTLGSTEKFVTDRLEHAAAQRASAAHILETSAAIGVATYFVQDALRNRAQQRPPSYQPKHAAPGQAPTRVDLFGVLFVVWIVAMILFAIF